MRRDMPDIKGAQKEIERELMRKAGKEIREEVEKLKEEITKMKKEMEVEIQNLKKEMYELKKDEAKSRIAQSATQRKG